MADLSTQTLPVLNPAAPAALPPGKQKEMQEAADKAALAKSFSLQNPLVAAGADLATLPGRGLGGAYNTLARIPNAFGANLPTIADDSPFFGGNSASMTPYFDKLRTPNTATPAAAPAPAPDATPSVVTAPSAVTMPAAAPKQAANSTAVQGLMDWARQAPTSEQMGTRYGVATRMLSAEAANTVAQTPKNPQLTLPQVLGQVQDTDPITGMATRNRSIYGTYNPNTGGWDPIKLPEIAPKAPLPAKADLQVGQVYPGYGKWTGTGFQPQ